MGVRYADSSCTIIFYTASANLFKIQKNGGARSTGGEEGLAGEKYRQGRRVGA